MSVTFSEKLIKEYQTEIYQSYGVSVSEVDAVRHLQSLTRTLFPTDIAESRVESRGEVQGKAQPACGSALSTKLPASGGNEVGASITPTSGHTTE